ncbi:hypothetical protein CMO92_05025 [Candidatus Woesearchaeota archaeon]|nr:hypothetical protein [Candidatus Woesearchaeota archaeon]
MNLKPHFSDIVAGIKISFAYKFDFLIFLITAPINLIIFAYLWTSIFSITGQEVIQGYTLQTMIDYFVLSLIVSLLAWSDVDTWIEIDNIKGNIIANFLKPVKFIYHNYFFELGLKIVGFCINIIPVLILAIPFLHLQIYSYTATAIALGSLFLASILTFMLTYIIGLTAFWLKRIQGLRRLKRASLLFLSGGIIPLSFFPVWYTYLSRFLPFEHIRYTPINIYLGIYTTTSPWFTNIYTILLIQIIWVLILWYLAVKIEHHAFKKFAGAGA